MKPISDFFPRMLPYLPGCPAPLAAQVILDAAIAFCESTQSVRLELEPFNTVPGEAVYSLEAPAQQQVARVLDVVVGGRRASPRAADNFESLGRPSGAPLAYSAVWGDDGFQVRLHPPPDKVYPVAVNVALQPARNATALHPDLFDLWVDAVLAGATARAMAIPGQPFSDPHGAMAYTATALRAASRARIEGGIGRVRPSLQVVGRPFA